VPLLTTGLVGSEEVSVDTDECLRGAKASHGDNPNDELDSFLACVLARLDAVETSDREVLDLKTQLAAIEDLPSFGKNGFKHNLARREAADEEEEGRGWKNKEKKRKNKKEKKRRKKFEINLPQEETSVKKTARLMILVKRRRATLERKLRSPLACSSQPTLPTRGKAQPMARNLSLDQATRTKAPHKGPIKSSTASTRKARLFTWTPLMWLSF